MAWWDKFPYTDYSSFNVDYWIQKFKQITDEWANLYDELKNWKVSTTEELTAWRQEVETSMQEWENSLLSDLANWKDETQDDISEWETEINNNLNTWKTNFEELFNRTFNNIVQIKTDAEAARDRAETAQAVAESARDSAINAADSVSNSATQIALNKTEIQKIKNSDGEYISVDAVYMDGGYIENSGANAGEIVPYDDWSYTDFIDVSSALYRRIKSVIIPYSTFTIGYNAIYDENKIFLSAFNANNRTIILPENAKYVRLSKPTGAKQELYSFNFGIAKIKNNAIIWEVGSFNNAGINVNTNTKFRSDFIYLDTSKKYIVNAPDGYMVGVTYFPESGNYIKFDNYIQYRIIDFPKRTAKIRLNLKKYDDSVVDIDDISIYSVFIEEYEELIKKDYLKIGTFNVGRWKSGGTQCTEAEYQEKRPVWHAFMGKYDVDILGQQEAWYYADAAKNHPSYNNFIMFKHQRISYTVNVDPNDAPEVRITSKFNFISEEDLVFDRSQGGSGRLYNKAKYIIGGKEICIINVHLGIEANSSGTRQRDLEMLRDIMDSNEYCIVMGDFNTYNFSEFTNHFSGKNMANGGDFGYFATWDHHDLSPNWVNLCIDNVITNPNMIIQNVVMPKVSNADGDDEFDTYLSDHRPLIVEIEII